MNEIDHIGIAVRSLQKSSVLFENLLGFSSYKKEFVESEEVNVEFFQAGRSKIELLEASSENSVIARYLDRKGEGIHHIAFKVPDIYSEMQRLKAAGFKLLNEQPKVGADNKLVCFVHPKDTNEVLIEICQENSVNDH